MPNIFDESQYTFVQVFKDDPDLKPYGKSALLLFALSLYLRIEDLSEFAAEAITEGSNDKKVDLCDIDEDEHVTVVAQSYLAEDWGRAEAPANKASDLNTGMAWLLTASEEHIPQRLKSKAIELRRGIAGGMIKRIDLLFVHNCFESTNVELELKAAAQSAAISANSLALDKGPIVVSYRELGLNRIEELYRTRDSEILIDGWLELPATQWIEETGTDWRALITTVPGNWIRELYNAHGDRLFSANFRDYMGSVNRKGNINNQIKETAKSEPTNFWVYNNGVTAITHELDPESGLRIRGISIINGAQTSGALGESAEGDANSAKVPLRIVECQSKELIQRIIQFNNTQNEIKPFDRRSNDQIQRRLRADFSTYGIDYIHRRSATRRPRNAITAEAVAPALCAFHGDPQTAFRNSKEIFNDDDTYQDVFPPRTSVEHIFLVRSLSAAIDKIKAELKKKVADETATQLEQQQFDVLKFSASKHFLLYALGAVSEEIMRRRVADLFEWKCKSNVMSADNISMRNSCETALHALLPQIATLVDRRGKDAAYDVPRNAEESKLVVRELKALLASLDSNLGMQFDELRRRTTL